MGDEVSQALSKEVLSGTVNGTPIQGLDLTKGTEGMAEYFNQLCLSREALQGFSPPRNPPAALS